MSGMLHPLLVNCAFVMMTDDGKVCCIHHINVNISVVVCSVMVLAASKPLTVSRSPHHRPPNTSLGNMISRSDIIGEDHEVCGKFTTEMIRLLVEVHCIFAQVSDNNYNIGL